MVKNNKNGEGELTRIKPRPPTGTLFNILRNVPRHECTTAVVCEPFVPKKADEKTPFSRVMESAEHNAPVALGGGGGTGEAGTVSVIRHVDRLKLPRSQVDTAELVDRAARGEDRCSAVCLRNFGVFSVHGHNLERPGRTASSEGAENNTYADGVNSYST